MAAARKARIALVDDHPLFRKGLAAALAGEPDLEVGGEAGTAAEMIELARTQSFDAAIIDVLMPGSSGISLTSELFEIQPRCRVLGLSVIDEPGLIADMLRAHACGFALKTQSTDEIVEAIRQVLGGIRYLPPLVSHDAVDAALHAASAHPLGRLTKREREVFELMIRGSSNDEIAVRLFIATRTVETHRQRIFKKLSSHSVAQLQRIAALHGGVLER